MYSHFYLTTSLGAVFINSLYCIAACKHYRMKFYFAVWRINKVIIIIILLGVAFEIISN